MIAVNCMGEMYGADPNPAPRKAVTMIDLNQSMQGPNLEDELNIDKATLQTLRELHSAKDEAVAREDFDEAKRLKVVIERIRGIATHLG